MPYKDPKKRRAWWKKYRESGARKNYNHQYYLDNKERFRANHRKSWLKKYGMTVEQYDAMLAAQGGGCAICGGPPGFKKAAMCVDHDHATGRVRGLLCHNCNVMLGHSKDSPDVLARAIEYLARQPAILVP